MGLTPIHPTQLLVAEGFPNYDAHHVNEVMHDNFDAQARFASSEESSACSSVLSSLESVESNTSEGGKDVTKGKPGYVRHRCYKCPFPVIQYRSRIRYVILKLFLRKLLYLENYKC